MRTPKFKTKVTITFYAAVNRNGHPKAETSKCCKWIETCQSRTRSTSHLFPERSATWLTAASTSNLLPLHQSHCYPNNQSKKLKKFHFPRVSPGDQTADQGAWGLWVRDCADCGLLQIHGVRITDSRDFRTIYMTSCGWPARAHNLFV